MDNEILPQEKFTKKLFKYLNDHPELIIEILLALITLGSPILISYLLKNRIITILSAGIVSCTIIIYFTFIKNRTKRRRAIGFMSIMLILVFCIILVRWSPWCKSHEIRITVFVDSTDEPIEVKEGNAKIVDAKPGTVLRIQASEYEEFGKSKHSNIRCVFLYQGDGKKKSESIDGCIGIIKFGIDHDDDIINIKISYPDCTGYTLVPLFIQPDIELEE